MPVQQCSEGGKTGFKWGSSGKCYTYTAGDTAGAKAAKKKANAQGFAAKQAGFMERSKSRKGYFNGLQEALMRALLAKEGVSDASWSSVDKSKLPKSAFLWVEGDGKTKDKWHLPYKDGSGNVNLGALRAIAAAVAGARSGTPMSIPADVKKKLDGLLKKHKIGQYADSVKKESFVAVDHHGSEDILRSWKRKLVTNRRIV